MKCIVYKFNTFYSVLWHYYNNPGNSLMIALSISLLIFMTANTAKNAYFRLDTLQNDVLFHY